MKTFNRLGLAIVCAAALSAMVAASARADTIYTYTGNDFNFIGNDPLSSFPFSTSDFVSGTIDLRNPIGDNAVNVTLSLNSLIFPGSFSFSNGVQSFNYPNQISILVFNFTNISTDSAGVITSWNILMFFEPGFDELFTANSGTITEDSGQTSRSFGSNQGMPGTWTVTTTPLTTTPLPSALPLFAGGLAALGLFGWRRKRKNGAALAA
ncbi:MAG TPA: hypothetical protein VGI22_19955 [Xanthobacteraceae bacterium]|jgi:hypothetical protein